MNKHRRNPFLYAISGLKQTFRSERNFRIHLVCSIVAIAMGIYTDLSASDWRWIFLCIGLVLALELVNTAMEAVVDLVSPEHHPLAKKAKDAAAAAVLVGAIFAFLVGISIFLPLLWALLFK